MTPRTVASGCVAVLGCGFLGFGFLGFGFLGFGLMLAPIEASARGGGFGAPRGPAPGGIHSMKPSGLHPWHAMRFHHRRAFRHGAPLQWGVPYSYGADYSAPYSVWYESLPPDPYAYPAAWSAPTPRHISVVVRPAICNTQTLKVPSESGGERAITVTRC